MELDVLERQRRLPCQRAEDLAVILAELALLATDGDQPVRAATWLDPSERDRHDGRIVLRVGVAEIACAQGGALCFMDGSF